MSPLSQRYIISNLKRIGVVANKKKLKMFKCEQTLHIMFGPALGQNLYPKDNEIHNFGRHIPALHHHALSSS
jgi:hypothetical protein